MTAEEIRATKNTCDDGAWQCAEWLKEIAAQLADANEQNQRLDQENAAKPDVPSAETLERTKQMDKMGELLRLMHPNPGVRART